MNLRSADPYWLYNTRLLHTYNTVTQNLAAEVVVVGTGISGALAAFSLVKAGCKVVIVSAQHVGMASTCASTSLLQYEIDTPLTDLIKKTGQKTAEESYLLCHQSIDDIERLHHLLGLKATFQKRKSLQLATLKKDVPDLLLEYEARKKIGIDLNFLPADKLYSDFGLIAPVALYSKQGAQIDAYLFTQKLVEWCVKNGATVYDKTEIIDIENKPRSVILKTNAGHTISARHVVMATGYESSKWLDINFARLHSTYVIISQPFKKEELWKDECLIWETAHPYIYMRCTADHRVIIGGKDEMFQSANKRDALLLKKSKLLLHAFYLKFPNMRFNIENAWAGTFAETADGLPYIGAVKKMPRVFFALGFGGNGITFSQIAADIITGLVTGQPNKNAAKFSFDRTINKA